MEITAALVKKLRDETDAPMMECKAALVEAEGDYERAKELLREKGKAAATKRAGRSTSEGTALFVKDEAGTTVAGIVLESETDFVARNDQFKALAKTIAQAFLANDPGNDPLAVQAEGGTVGELIERAVAVIRENIRLAKAVRYTGGQAYAIYLHHTGKQASLVQLEGDASNLQETGTQVAIQVVAVPETRFLKKEDVPADVIEHEIQVETTRAINEGKKPEIAENIARGRVNKEFYQSQVLLEQPFYLDPKKTVSAYIAEQNKAGGGTTKVVAFSKLAVGDE